ncbi:hypothetical protein [Streptomyces sp. NPDC004232]|uniref:hypothetical protein n=1 Tax=unclassified Streptomyces TaxID=2593676 RepID=UPI001D9F2890|nr:hypothetical protein [Streptomyces sp. tea 10]
MLLPRGAARDRGGESSQRAARLGAVTASQELRACDCHQSAAGWAAGAAAARAGRAW